MTDDERKIERELIISAEPEAVWRALTEGDEIMRWFAPSAESTPGPDGVIRLRWNDSTFEDCEIIEWDPAAHLTIGWRTSLDPERNLPVDIRLQRTDGGTVLRLVHSGFLSDESWDDEFDSHGRGWSYELRSLKYYLEHQWGRARQMISRRILIPDGSVAWQALFGPQGLFQIEGMLEEGASVTLTLPTGEQTTARVFYVAANAGLALVADVLDGGIFRFSLETFAGQWELYVWAMSWQLAQNQLERLALPCMDAIERYIENHQVKEKT